MNEFQTTLSAEATQPVIGEFFAAYRTALEAETEGTAPDIADFLQNRGVDVPSSGTLSVVFTENKPGVEPMRPVPDCPGGCCVPELCPDHVKQCGWVCYCP